MKKKIYKNPSMRVINIQQPQLLSGSPDPWGSQDPKNPYDFGAPALYECDECDAMLTE